MNLRNYLRVATFSATGLFGLACYDAKGPTKPQRDQATPASERSRTAPIAVPNRGTGGRSLAEARRRNPMDWVGVAHNRSVALFARELRAKRIRRGHLCEEIVRIIVENKKEILPAKHREIPDAEWKRGAKAGAVRAGCGRKESFGGAFSHASLLQPPEWSPLFHIGASTAPATPESEAIQSLLNATAEAASSIDDAASLGEALNAILDNASQLADTSAAQAVQGAVAVAVHSYEYWASNGYQVADDVRNAYASCLGEPDCVDDGRGEWEVRQRESIGAHGSVVRSVVHRSGKPLPCELHRSSWVGTDVATFAWLTGAAFFTMGPIGALLASPASAGAAATASAAAFVFDVVAYIICMI